VRTDEAEGEILPSMKLSLRLALVLSGLMAIAVIVVLFDLFSPEGKTLGTAVATAGTAIGTVGLALYTYELAKSTQKAVDDGDKQLAELQRQVKSTAELATASKAQVEQAFKSRIDIYSPLVGIHTELQGIQYLVEPGGFELVPGSPVEEEPLYPIEVVVGFTFQNYGKSPALLTFSGLAATMDFISTAQSKRIVLQPEQTYEDILRFTAPFNDFVLGHPIDILVTCNGLLHGEMSDEVYWRGLIRPFKNLGNGGREVAEIEDMIDSAGSQIVREYPNLERPDDMEAARARLKGRDPAGPSDLQVSSLQRPERVR
jgi:hypothetical protein